MSWKPPPGPAGNGTGPAAGDARPTESRPADARPLDRAEREEYERLRAAGAGAGTGTGTGTGAGAGEGGGVAVSGTGAPGGRRGRGRTVWASVLLVVAVLLAPFAVVAAWLESEVSDTDRYVSTVAPLATDPAVQNLVISRLTTRVVDNVDVNGVTSSVEDALRSSGAPAIVVDHAGALSGVMSSALTDVVHGIVSGVVTSDQFASIWADANRRVQPVVMKVLTGEGGGAITTSGDAVVLDIGAAVDAVRTRLVDAGFGRAADIPNTDRTIVLFQTKELSRVQGWLRVLDVLGLWLPVAVGLLLLAGVWLMPDHRVAVMAAGVGLGVMMLVLLVLLAVVRGRYLDSVQSAAQSQDAAKAIYDTLVRFLRGAVQGLLLIAAIMIVSGWLLGPSRYARTARRGMGSATGAVGHRLGRAGLRTGSAGRWLADHRRLTSAIVVAAGILTLILWSYPTAATVAVVLLIVVVLLALLEVLAVAAEPAPGPGPGPAPGPAPGPSGGVRSVGEESS